MVEPTGRPAPLRLIGGRGCDCCFCGTRPQPILGALAQSGSHRIAFDVAENGQQMIIFLYRKRPEAALPDMTAAVVNEFRITRDTTVRADAHFLSSMQPG